MNNNWYRLRVALAVVIVCSANSVTSGQTLRGFLPCPDLVVGNDGREVLFSVVPGPAAFLLGSVREVAFRRDPRSVAPGRDDLLRHEFSAWVADVGEVVDYHRLVRSITRGPESTRVLDTRVPGGSLTIMTVPEPSGGLLALLGAAWAARRWRVVARGPVGH